MHELLSESSSSSSSPSSSANLCLFIGRSDFRITSLASLGQQSDLHHLVTMMRNAVNPMAPNRQPNTMKPVSHDLKTKQKYWKRNTQYAGKGAVKSQEWFLYYLKFKIHLL